MLYFYATYVSISDKSFTVVLFYSLYVGISDNVKCFFCDGGLRNWEPNDDPWTEHARWFPRCGYIRLCKGDEFIKEVQQKYAPPPVVSYIFCNSGKIQVTYLSSMMHKH